MSNQKSSIQRQLSFEGMFEESSIQETDQLKN